ncbi:MAG: hypothetical protein ACOH2F_15460 [Cellulomonas sp.]
MTYPRWATERSDQTAAGESPEPVAAPFARWRHRRLLAAILALVVIAVILILVAVALTATPDLATPAAVAGVLPLPRL